MKTIHKSLLIWFSAEQMFDLVADVPRYSEFLPWCDGASIVQTHDDGVTAEVGMQFGGFHKSFTTRNTHTPGRQVRLALVEGPFKQLDGVWNFTPLATDEQSALTNPNNAQACRIELTLNYAFEGMLGMMIGPIFDKVADTLVDSFVKRAEQMYPSAA